MREPVGIGERIDAIVAGFASLRVLVVGDLMLDDYRIGEIERISPEAPVPIVCEKNRRTDLGGAGNVARGIVALGAHCSLVAVAGMDSEGDRLIELLETIGVSSDHVLRSAGRPTSHKIRVLADGRQMLRIDREDAAPLAAEHLSRLRTSVSTLLTEVDVVILQDYDKGIFADGMASWLIEFSRQKGKFVIADPKRDLARFRGASLVKPNAEEAHAFMPGTVGEFKGRRAMLEKIQRELGGSEVVMTRGAGGMTALDVPGVATDVPTRPAEDFDVQGAGDTTVATLALCRAVGASLIDACIVANAAASIVVGKSGTAVVDVVELRRQLPVAIAAFEEKM